MRGKETDSRRQCCSAGITPAYAGKRTLFCLAGRRNRDHPRVCGEKGRTGALDVVQRGSPPRMRGKVRELLFSFHCARITPAYAGKSAANTWITNKIKDHPRVCGEKEGYRVVLTFPEGSPPRMRGKGRGQALVVAGAGITPAYAGKRFRSPIPLASGKDHPRVCGEKNGARVISNTMMGSPPRMRGKAGLENMGGGDLRITPAYAGKRTPPPRAVAQLKDHPRVCGEKFSNTRRLLFCHGSPPRMRGKD